MNPTLSTVLVGAAAFGPNTASASPATGSAKAHELEQKTLLSLAFTTMPAE